MSGKGAMSVTYDYSHLEGCMAGESLLCQEFAQTFVRCAAGVNVVDTVIANLEPDDEAIEKLTALGKSLAE